MYREKMSVKHHADFHVSSKFPLQSDMDPSQNRIQDTMWRTLEISLFLFCSLIYQSVN